MTNKGHALTCLLLQALSQKQIKYIRMPGAEAPLQQPFTMPALQLHRKFAVT